MNRGLYNRVINETTQRHEYWKLYLKAAIEEWDQNANKLKFNTTKFLVVSEERKHIFSHISDKETAIE